MGTRAGVGYSENPRSREAGIEAARAAMKEVGVGPCDLVLMYSTEKHDPEQLRAGVRSVVGTRARLIGGYSIGIITRDRLGYEGYQVGVAALASDTVTADLFIERGLPDNEEEVGYRLAKQILSKDYRGTPNILLMYDSVKRSAAEGLGLNMATPLIEGMSRAMRTWPPTAGVGMVGSMQWNPTYEWFDDRIEQGCAMALVLSGGIRLDSVNIHGCKPTTAYHVVTKVDGPVVLEIDDKPALDAIAELLGPECDRTWEDYPLFITLGLNKGDKFGPFREEDYANRLALAVDRERRGLVMFENDLKAGHEIQLMRRSIDFDYIDGRINDLLGRLADRKPIFALYIDCAGRASAYCGTEREEGEEVQRIVGSKMPLLGMYSGVEIAKVGNDLQVLDWTGVLCVFSE